MQYQYQQAVYDQLRALLDPDARHGMSIPVGSEPKLFDARPAAHPSSTSRALRRLYDSLENAARAGKRLAHDKPLIRRWKLDYDVYSPKLGRFIEVDERQHFSCQRLLRIRQGRGKPGRSLYPAYFWESVLDEFPPARDFDPQHRDEQRAYLDEARELLPLAYGFAPTIRLDQYSLKLSGRTAIELIQEIRCLLS
jgi:hypothetical protein